MKSINEKAEEYGLLNPDIHYDADGNTYDDVDKPSMDFEAGANYVLEQIEEFQKLFSTCMNAHANGYLKSVIEQLKK